MSEKTISRYCPFKGFWVLGVLHKSVWLRSLTLCVEPFRFKLQIFGDIHNRKNDLVSWGVNKMVYRYNVSKADSPTHRVVFRLRISSRIQNQNRSGSKCSVRDICRTDLCIIPRKSASLPCPFKCNVK